MGKLFPPVMMRKRDIPRGLRLLTASVMLLILAAPARACQLALILAHDTSSSVSKAEYDLQTQGHAAAFRDPEIQREILAMGEIQTMLIHWSSHYDQQRRIPWRRLRTREDIEAFADDLSSAWRRFDVGSTAIGNLMRAVSGAWREAGPDRCLRRVLDISGDGVSNQGAPVGPARAQLLAERVTINGLVTVNDELVEAPPLSHYRNKVIGGPGAFVIEAKGFEDYARAFRKKLLRELKGLDVASRPGEKRARLNRPPGNTAAASLQGLSRNPPDSRARR